MKLRMWMKRSGRLLFGLVVGVLLVLSASMTAAAPRAAPKVPKPKFSTPAAFDTTPTLRDMAKGAAKRAKPRDLPPERGPAVADRGHSADGALQRGDAQLAAAITAPIANFEGLSNQDNFNVFGFRVNPPDPVGDVGPNHYVEMVNLVFAVYSKSGTLLLGPVDTGTLWAGFAVDDCTDASGDPIVIYDQFADRWILSQFTTRGLDDPSLPFYNCIAISQTGDPTGAYFRYAFTTGFNFPDYPKYGVWRDSYIITTREFGPTIEYGIGVYALDRNKIIEGDPAARAVSFFLDGNDPTILPLVGDGLLPPDIDGKQKPKNDVPAPIVGTQDDGGPYGATFDALNIWELDVKWRSTPLASLILKTQLPVASFDSIFPCGVVAGSRPPSSRDCLPQPGVTDGSRFLDILILPTAADLASGLPQLRNQ